MLTMTAIEVSVVIGALWSRDPPQTGRVAPTDPRDNIKDLCLYFLEPSSSHASARGPKLERKSAHMVLLQVSSFFQSPDLTWRSSI